MNHPDDDIVGKEAKTETKVTHLVSSTDRNKINSSIISLDERLKLRINNSWPMVAEVFGNFLV